MRAITIQPYKVQPAFNNIIIRISDTENIDSGTPHVSLDVFNGATLEKYTMRRNLRPKYNLPYNSFADFDISQRVKTFFYDSEYPLSLQNGIFYDSNLAIHYDFELPHVFSGYELWAVNAVRQIGESLDLESETDKFLLIAQGDLKKYSGYPLRIAGAAKLNGQTKIGRNKTLFATMIYVPIFTVDVLDTTDVIFFNKLPDELYSDVILNSGDKILLNDGNTVTVYNALKPSGDDLRYVKHVCTPDNPFYVRWINTLGGYEYFMFSHRQFEKRKVQNTQLFYPTIEDSETAKYNVNVASLEIENTIKVGASEVTQSEMLSLFSLLQSPKIQLYNEKNKTWEKIILENGEDLQRDTRSPLQNVELSFMMQKLYTQF